MPQIYGHNKDLCILYYNRYATRGFGTPATNSYFLIGKGDQKIRI